MDDQDKYDVPQELPVILRDWIREVLRYNPENIVDFSHTYFSALANTGSVSSSSLHDYSTGSTHIGVYSVPEKQSYATFQSGVDPQYENIRSERAEAYTSREDMKNKDVFTSVQESELDDIVEKEDVVMQEGLETSKSVIAHIEEEGKSVEPVDSEYMETVANPLEVHTERKEKKQRQISHYSNAVTQFKEEFVWPGRSEELSTPLLTGKAMLLHRILGGSLIDPQMDEENIMKNEEDDDNSVQGVQKETIASILRIFASNNVEAEPDSNDKVEIYNDMVYAIDQWRNQADARIALDDAVSLISVFSGNMKIPEFLDSLNIIIPQLPGLRTNNLHALDTVATVSYAGQRKYHAIYEGEDPASKTLSVTDIHVINDEVLDILGNLPVNNSTADEDLRSAQLGKSFDVTLLNAQNVLLKLRELANTSGIDTLDEAYDAATTFIDGIVHTDDPSSTTFTPYHTTSESRSSSRSSTSRLLQRVDRVISQRQQDLLEVIDDLQLEGNSKNIAYSVLFNNLDQESVTDMLLKEVQTRKTQQPLEPEHYIAKSNASNTSFTNNVLSTSFTEQEMLQHAMQQTESLTNPEFTFVVNTILPKRQAYLQTNLAPKVQSLTNTFLDLDVELNGTLSVELVQSIGSIVQTFKNTQKAYYDYYNEQALYIDQCEPDEQVNSTDFIMYLLHKANTLDNQTFKEALAYATDSLQK